MKFGQLDRELANRGFKHLLYKWDDPPSGFALLIGYAPLDWYTFTTFTIKFKPNVQGIC